MLDACVLDKPFSGSVFEFITLMCSYYKDQGLNAEEKPLMCGCFSVALKGSEGKQHRKPDTTYMFVRDYSVVLIRLTMLQNIQTGGGFKAVIGGTYTGKTRLNHY